MNRRSFLHSIAAAVGTISLDPEKLPWTPAAKLISVPVVRRNELIDLAFFSPGMLRVFENNARMANLIDIDFLSGDQWGADVRRPLHRRG